ncbi:glutathione S-transferase [Astrocystis sublimbata]|nr:glutathione S-transferase [Astrocystis sublimbata]
MPLQQSTLSVSSLRTIRSLLSRSHSKGVRSITAYNPPAISSQSTSSRNSHTTRALPLNSFLRASYSTSNQQTPQQVEEMSEPTGFSAKSGIELLTFGTPNGYKVSILLEELKEAYGKEYTWQSVNIMKNTQKEPWFIAACANGRIPAIVDHDRNDFSVFEGLAILGYLTRRYDPENKVSFPVDSNEYDEAETWMAWQHGGVGPMQGQANHFLRFAKEKIPYGIQRYIGETERLYGVLNARLEGRDYVVGNKFSIADINLVGWANATLLGGIDLETQFPNVHKWLERCLARPAVQKGFAIPSASSFSNSAVKKSLETDPEFKKQAEQSAKLVQDSKDKYGYKYSSP